MSRNRNCAARKHLAAVSAMAFSCGLAGFAGCNSAPINPSPDLGPRSTLSDEQAAAARTACTFQSGAMPGLSVAQTARIGSQIPIDTVVVVIMENRSYDHILATLPAANGADAGDLAATNPDPHGVPIARFHLQPYCIDDPNHGWNEAHWEWDGGKNDGFVVWNEYNNGAPADGRRAMGYYTAADLPVLYSLASRFAVADRYFSPLLGPTFPNREYAYAATSFGMLGNDLITTPRPNIFESLSTAGVNWHEYYETYPGSAIFVDTFAKHFGDNYDTLSVFEQDAAAGTLANVVYVDPNLRDDGAVRDDLHAPGDAQLGDQFIAKVVSAVVASPQWPHAAIFITFDEHGGFYDHVPPPAACPPDALLPTLAPTDAPGGFDRYGIRVPLIVVSPYAKPHYASHLIYDHTSILRFIETRFSLAALTARDANADPMLDLFDFDNPAFTTPPAVAAPVVDATQLAACKALYPIGYGDLDAGVLDAGNPDGGI